MRTFRAFAEGSQGFRSPYEGMTPEDRKEANRLFNRIMRVMPSSPRQKELMRKYAALMAKYGKWDAEAVRRYLGEDWSPEYKRSINCNRPKGFSQRAHCQGRKKSGKGVAREETIRYDVGMEDNMMNTSDSDETLTETTVRVYGAYGSWEYDISKDEGIIKALQQSHLQRISAAATDSWNVTQAEREAIKKNEGLYDTLVRAAAKRRLKVRYSGIGGDYTTDYGSKEYDKYR